MSVEFDINRLPRTVADDVEGYARAQGSVAALVVPWESTATTLSMAVTLVKADGWAIEHTNLGTITLTPRDNGTHVAIIAHEPERADRVKLLAVFERFSRDLEKHLGRDGGQAGDGGRPR